ncbi:MAG: FHA domain-containing protein [Hungatella sp.]|nr:FHA domain-containing protein [Hungatella sp.]
MEEINLKVSYHREMKNNYLMIEAEELEDQRFEAKMLVGNTIDGLLKFRIRKTDNNCQFCYEITSKQPLKRLLETRTIGARQLRTLLMGIAQTLTRMEEYLLSEEQIILDPDFIYVDPEDYVPGLCLMPGKRGDFPQEFSSLLQGLLEKVDHQDKEAVILIYGLYRESLKENYGLDNLLQWLMREKCSDMDNNNRDEKTEIIEKKEQISEISEKQVQSVDDRIQLNLYREKVRIPFKEIFLCVMFMPCIGIGLWLIRGPKAVFRFLTEGLVFVIVGGLISMTGVLFFIWRWKRMVWHNSQSEELIEAGTELSSKFTEDDRNNSWQMVFSEEAKEGGSVVEEKEEESHTVLLWSKEPETVRRLVSEDGKSESISIAYFPFLIGKQENLTDYTLCRDTVSRIHVRIDQKEENYLLTDLNSTNGTSVNGRKLENNETVNLKIGDQIGIADLYFSFQ